MTKRRELTLTELLIVIAVLCVLMSRMLLSTTQAAATGDAARIVANMETIRNAALEWYADNRPRLKDMYAGRIPRKRVGDSRDILVEIVSYIDSPESLTLNENNNNPPKEGGYGICDVPNYPSTWYVGYKFARDETSVKEKLKSNAKRLGIHFSRDWPNPDNIDSNKIGDDVVWMYILGDMSRFNL